MTRVFVTVDIEGVAGVAHPDEGNPGNPEYERARRLMTNEASAVVAGIFDTDDNAHVTVADVHGPYRNMIPELLDERATFLRGKPRHFGMMDGIEDGGYDCAMFIGVHGKSGTDDSVLSHTFTGSILDVVVNGSSWGELGLNAAMAGAYGVPVVLVSGDQSVAAESEGVFGEGVVPTVQVKSSRSHFASASVHPGVACRMLREAAATAIRNPRPVPPLTVTNPVTVEVTLNRPVLADLVGMLDDIERIDGRTLRFTRADFPNAYRILRLITVLCSAPV
jgi:D-amino peptidase